MVASSASGCSGLGFDSFGSVPSLIAFKILTAFHFAYLIFCRVSGSAGPQMFIRLRKVAAASNVLAVFLRPSQRNGVI